jgi:putative ABC transport system permease protein
LPSLPIRGSRYRVIGLADYTSIINRGLAIMPLADLQDASFRPRQVTMVHVNVARGAGTVAEVRQRIEALGNVSAVTANDILRNDRNFAILDAVSLAISIIALAMGALSVLNALVMTTQERTREIGILAAIGWSDLRIMTSLVVEGLAMCAIGCVVGLGLSCLSAFAFPLIPAIGDLIAFRPKLPLILLVFAATSLLCTLGALLPAWRAVRLMPAEALRRT